MAITRHTVCTLIQFFFLSDFFLLFCGRDFHLMTGIVCHVSNDIYCRHSIGHYNPITRLEKRFICSSTIDFAFHFDYTWRMKVSPTEINQIKFKASIVLILCDVRRGERRKKGNIILRKKRNTLTYIRTRRSSTIICDC